MSFPRDEILRVLREAGHDPVRSDGPDSHWFRCVFHEDQTPSMHVLAGDQNVFKCFGCPEKGGVVALADHLGIEIVKKRRGRPRKEDEWKTFAEDLWIERGREAREILHKRGLTDETLRRFNLGVTFKLLPYERGPLFRITLPVHNEQGVYVGCRRYHPQGETSTPHEVRCASDENKKSRVAQKKDLFTFNCPSCSTELSIGRDITSLTCQVCSEKLLVSGVPAKILGGWRMPVVLYGASKLSSLTRFSGEMNSPVDTVYIAEGEFDRLILEQNGFHAVTGTGGAATWKPAWSELFDGLRVVILYDGDKAGQLGSAKVLDALQERGKCARLKCPDYNFPEGSGWKDACDWFGPAGRSAEALAAMVEASGSFITVKEMGGGGGRGRGGSSGDDGDPEGILEQILELRSIKMKQHDRRFQISELILQDLLSRGKFIQTEESEFYYFDDEDRRLYRLFADEFHALLHGRYRINANIEQEYKYLQGHLIYYIINNAKMLDVQTLSYYDARTLMMYVSQFNGSVLRVGVDSIEVVANGTDDVFFLDSKKYRPWEAPDELPSMRDAIDELTQYVTDIHFDDRPVTAGVQQNHLLLWMISLFFGSAMATRPLAVFLGPAGSGKSYAFKRFLKLLFGAKADVTSISGDDQDSFEAAIMGSALVVFDNIDSPSKWLADALATVATGRELTKRKLYTTLDKATFKPTCFVGITSRTPRYTRPDVVDRLLIMRVDRRPEGAFQSEQQMIPGEEQRNRFFAAVCRVVQGVLVQVRDRGWPKTSSQRMADWVITAGPIGWALGWSESETHAVLQELERQRAEFLGEESDLISALDRMFSEDPTKLGKRYSTNELATELNRLQEIYREKYRYNYRHLGKRLREVQHAMRIRWDVDVENVGKGTFYTFEHRIEVEEDDRHAAPAGLPPGPATSDEEPSPPISEEDVEW